MAVVLSSVGLGMSVAEASTVELLGVFPTVATILVGIGVLHHAYTDER